MIKDTNLFFDNKFYRVIHLYLDLDNLKDYILTTYGFRKNIYFIIADLIVFVIFFVNEFFYKSEEVSTISDQLSFGIFDSETGVFNLSFSFV